ncbi:hypothetical protein, partial [Nocardia sp. NPDC003648]
MRQSHSGPGVRLRYHSSAGIALGQPNRRSRTLRQAVGRLPLRQTGRGSPLREPVLAGIALRRRGTRRATLRQAVGRTRLLTGRITLRQTTRLGAALRQAGGRVALRETTGLLTLGQAVGRIALGQA